MPIYSQAGFDLDLCQVNTMLCSTLPFLSGVGTVIALLETRENGDHLAEDMHFVPASLQRLLC